MILRPTAVSTEKFSYHGSVFTCEISDLGPGFQFGRVYDDACDEGLTLVSHRTGREVVYVVNHQQYKEGELVAWELIPAKPSDRPRCGSIVIYND